MHRSRRHTAVALLASLTAVWLCAGCETVVEVEAPPHEPRLVAESYFTSDSLWAVRVTSTAPYVSPTPPPYVENASVEIWDADVLIATPVRVDSGTYVARGRPAARGTDYTLRVSAPAYETIEGVDALPPPVPLAAFADTLVRAADSRSRRQVTHVDITLDDRPTRRDHYGLFVVQARWREDRGSGQRTPLPPTLFTFESDEPALDEEDLDFLHREKQRYRQAFFSDRLFDGRRHTIEFAVQYDAPNPDAPVVIRRALYVVLLSVSEDFYSYWTTAARQASTNENPFAEPLRVHSNMRGGFGVFGGFDYRIIPLDDGDESGNPVTLDDLCLLGRTQLPVCSPAPPPE